MFSIITYFISKDIHYREGLKEVLEITIPILDIKTFNEIPKSLDNSDISLIIIEPEFEENINCNIEQIEYITSSYDVRICLLLTSENQHQLLELLNYRIHGVLFKSKYTYELIKGIKQVLKGGHYIPESVGKLLLDVYRG